MLKVERKNKRGKFEFNIIYDKNYELGSLNAYRLEVDCGFYLIGGLKFLFVMVGRSGF